MKKLTTLSPFLGVITSLDSKLVKDAHASDQLNVRHEDGCLRPRRGWRNIAEATEAFTAVYGLDIVRGYTDDAENEEYVLVQDSTVDLEPSQVRAYAVNPLTGTQTELTDAAETVELFPGDWHSFGFNGQSFTYPVGGAVRTHTPGTDDDFTPLDYDAPEDPGIAPTLAFRTDDKYAQNVPGSTVGWAGATADTLSDWSIEGTQAGLQIDFDSVDGDGNLVLTVEHSGGSKTIFIELDLEETTIGMPDWSEASWFDYSLIQDWTAPGVVLNPDGSEWETHIESNTAAIDNANNSQTSSHSPNGNGSGVWRDNNRAAFSESYVGSSYTQVKKVRIYLECTRESVGGGSLAGTSTITLKISPLVPNEAAEPPELEDDAYHALKFGYSWYDQERDLESPNVIPSISYKLVAPLSFYDMSEVPEFLGNVPTMTIGPATQDFIGHYRRYVWFEDEGIWRLIDTVSLNENDYEEEITDVLIQELEYTYLVLRQCPQRRVKKYEAVGDVRYGTTYGGSAVWLKSGYEDNVHVSAIGNAARLAAPEYDLETDLTRGRRFSMSPSRNDEPIAAASTETALIILGRRGAYATTGVIPALLTPIRRLPGSKGVLGPRALARWRDNTGMPGVAYVTDSQELWFVAAAPGFNGEAGFTLRELSHGIRGLIRSFLTQTDDPDTTKLCVFTDERSDSLWLVYESRAIVLRRPSLVDGERQIECYEYQEEWSRICGDPYWGIRGCRATGELDEFERDSSDDFADLDIEAFEGDGDHSIFWESKTFHESNRRAFVALVEREDMSDTVELTCTADRTNETIEVSANTRHARFEFTTQGWNLKYRLTLASDSSAVTKAIIEERYGSRRLLS